MLKISIVNCILRYGSSLKAVIKVSVPIFLSFQIISWLHTQGNECLQRHLEMADNLKGVKSQQKDFEKFYFAAIVSTYRLTY